jgi:hypothetical protein
MADPPIYSGIVAAHARIPEGSVLKADVRVGS